MTKIFGSDGETSLTFNTQKSWEMYQLTLAAGSMILVLIGCIFNLVTMAKMGLVIMLILGLNSLFQLVAIITLGLGHALYNIISWRWDRIGKEEE